MEIVDFKLRPQKGEGANASRASERDCQIYNGRRFKVSGLATDIVESGVKPWIYGIK